MPNRFVKGTQVPALQKAPPGPLREYLDQMNGTLRTYFTALSSGVNSILGSFGMQFIEASNGFFYSDADQPLDTINVAQNVTFSDTYLNNGITLGGGDSSEITVTYSGIYSVQFSGQIASSSASDKVVWVWIARNGTDMGFSTRAYSIEGAGKLIEITKDFVLDLEAGDMIQILWSGDDADTELSATAAAGPHPGISSAVLAIHLVSALPATLPAFP